MPEPTIGRIVRYHSFGTPKGEYKPKPVPAMITQVSEDSNIRFVEGNQTVGLVIFNPTGLFFNAAVPFAKKPTPGHWSWPPYTPPATPAQPVVNNLSLAQCTSENPPLTVDDMLEKLAQEKSDPDRICALVGIINRLTGLYGKPGELATEVVCSPDGKTVLQVTGFLAVRPPIAIVEAASEADK